MPNKPKTLAERTRKRDHKYYDRHRNANPVTRANAKLRSSVAWKKTRLQALYNNPLCAECQRMGIVRPAVDVDHIVPLSVAPDLALVVSNLQGLCRRCHAQKSSRERVNG